MARPNPDRILARAAAVALPDGAGDAEGDVWVMLMPLGELRARDGRAWTVADADAVVRRSQPGPGGPSDLPVDYEHQSENPETGDGGPKPAAGWIDRLEAREDGIYGRVRWNARAAAMVAAREYRFLSPVFFHTPGGMVDRIVGAGLTHRPALEMMALASERSTASADDIRDPAAMLAQLRDAAGLDPDAPLAELLAFCRDRAGAGPDPSRFVPIAAVAELARDRGARIAHAREEATERAVAAAVQDGYITPGMRAWATALCRDAPDRFEAFLAASPGPAFAHLFRPMPGRGAEPAASSGGKHRPATDAERALCRQLGIDRLAP